MEIEFQRVWNRVKAAGSVDEAATLDRLIRDEQQDAAAYSHLARMTGTPHVRRLLTGLAEDERRHARRLQAAAFMLFGGDTVQPARIKNGNERILGALRKRYARELEGIEAYRAAAASTANNTLKKLYAELCGEEDRHAAALCSLIEELL